MTIEDLPENLGKDWAHRVARSLANELYTNDVVVNNDMLADVTGLMEGTLQIEFWRAAELVLATLQDRLRTLSPGGRGSAASGSGSTIAAPSALRHEAAQD